MDYLVFYICNIEFVQIQILDNLWKGLEKMPKLFLNFDFYLCIMQIPKHVPQPLFYLLISKSSIIIFSQELF